MEFKVALHNRPDFVIEQMEKRERAKTPPPPAVAGLPKEPRSSSHVQISGVSCHENQDVRINIATQFNAQTECESPE